MDIPFFKSAVQSKGLGFFLKKEVAVLGIDIGSTSIKMIQLGLQAEKAVLETYGELAIGPATGGKVGQAAHLNDTKASEIVSDIVRETGATAKEAVVSIPLRNSFITLVEMPRLNDTELEEAMQYEARRYIPIPMSEVVVDWWRLPDESGQEVSSAVPRHATSAQILLVAVPKEVVEKYKRILTAAGLTPIAFEIETFGAIRSVVSHERFGVLVVDFGAVTTKMTILDRGIIRASHSFEKGFQDMTVALSQSLGVDFERAEAMKRETGLSSKPEQQGIFKVISPLMDYILIEVERFSANYSRRYNLPISKIYILGGGSVMQGLVDYMSKRFGVEILVANPFAKVEYPPFFQPVLKEIGPTFAVAVGLALRGLKPE